MGNILRSFFGQVYAKGCGLCRYLFAKAPIHLSNDAVKVLSMYDTLIFDCDGVLYHNMKAITNSDKFVHEALRLQKQCIFVTNASGNSRAGLFKRLNKLGFNLESNPFSEEQMVTSSSAAAAYVQQNYPGCKRAYFVGKPGVQEEIERHGIIPVGMDDTGTLKNLVEEEFIDNGLDDIGAVIVAHVDEELCYERMAKGTVYARNRKRPFIVTNLDQCWYFEYEKGNAMYPAAGAAVHFITTAAEREPDVIVGKPSADLAKVLQKQFNLYGKKVLMIGDRLNTDIAFGKNGGMDTLLVLSGCHGMEDVKQTPVQDRPTYIATKLGDIVNCL